MLARVRLLSAVFAMGALSGVALSSSAAREPASERVEVEHTGWPFATSEKKLDPTPAPTATRTIARRALDFTVYLRGGPVYGAGLVLDEKGHVLTCDHVIDGVSKIDVFTHDDPTPRPARVLDRDKALDLALLRVDFVPKSTAAVASVVDVEMGDEVYAMGAPRKMSFSLGRGIVSFVGRSFDGTLYVQTDLAANPGSSGGPVLNERGQVIGVSSFVLRGSQGLSFAVPIDYAFTRFDKWLAARPDGERFTRWLAARGSAAAPPQTEAPIRATTAP